MSIELESQFNKYVSNNLKKKWCKKTLNITFIPSDIKFCIGKEKITEDELNNKIAFELERYGIVKTIKNEYIRISDSLSNNDGPVLKFGGENNENDNINGSSIVAMIK
jgi:hypothetical protein